MNRTQESLGHCQVQAFKKPFEAPQKSVKIKI